MFAEELTKKNGLTSIKVDTHKENYKMNGFLKKFGYVEMGYLPSINRIAFEKMI
jgi:ribosomal protein S18 acetylase RimI-like enzyme